MAKHIRPWLGVTGPTKVSFDALRRGLYHLSGEEPFHAPGHCNVTSDFLRLDGKR